MSESRFSPKLIAGAIVALFFGFALYLRIVFPYDQVFVGDWIKFTAFDPYYHMRIVDNLIHNFPHQITFDPYLLFPKGSIWPHMPFFDWLLAGVILLIGLGSPAQHTVDVVGIYFPAVLGALTVIPVYFIGKELFNRWAGVISAGLIAVLPGEFLSRSILGFTDHHVAEVLFTTVTMLFLILAVKTAQQRQLNFSHLRHRDWLVVTRPLVYSLLAGIFLGIYLITWQGGPLFVFIILVYFLIQFIIDHAKHKFTDYLCIIGIAVFFIALVMFLPVSQEKFYVVPLLIALLTPLVLNAISRLMATRDIKRIYYPAALVVLGAAGLAIFQAIDPSLLKSLLGRFTLFMPGSIALTISEKEPLLLPHGSFSFSTAWSNFATGFFLSLISLGILTRALKRGEADKTLLVVWSLAMLMATLGQRRFAYYFAVNVALLTGYLSWLILEFAGFKKLAVKPVEPWQTGKRKKSKLKKTKRAAGLATSRVYMALGLIVVFFLVFFPNIGPAMKLVRQVPFAPDNAWCESLSWLKDNTPDPFGDPGFYYELYESPPPGKRYQYPETAYGVMAWWDYGHWIIRIAHRPPNHGPGGGWNYDVARFLTAQEEAPSHEIINKLGSRYIIIDYETATFKFHALTTFAGSSEENFYDDYRLPVDGKLESGHLFYPEYYRSLAVRLYNFDGGQVIPQNTTVISYTEKVGQDGNPYKEITSVKSFPKYEEAESYISSQESSNYRIVGINPFSSPVPLEALEHYKLIYSSDELIMLPDVGLSSKVKIFEYIK